jgi:hypothetical protein
LKSHQAVLDFRGDPPGWNLPNVKLHRAVLDLINFHRAVMNLIAESPGCCGLTPFKFKLEKLLHLGFGAVSRV